MSKLHKTALGKSFDMAAFRTKNEKVRAVGNMNVNSRGDTIDSNNNVIQDNTKRVNQHYARGINRNVNRAATTQTQPKQQDVYSAPSDIDDDIPNPKK